MKTLLFLLFSLSMTGQHACESILYVGDEVLLRRDGLLLLLNTGIQEPAEGSTKREDTCGETVIGQRGYGFFSRSNGRFHFDFESQLLCRLDEKEVLDLITSGYTEIKSDFSRQGVSVHLNIKRKDFAYRFDTGYSGSFCIAYNDNIPFIKDSHLSIDNIQGTTDLIYGNRWISMNGTYYSGAVTVSKIKASKVGMAFLKGFNWIIDFDKRKVYFKKNGSSLENADRKVYETSILGGKITVVSKNSQAKEHQLGDIVTAVNGEKVTPGNICEIQELLTKTAHWETLQIETDHNE